jgi:NAD(P)-dependent dehydrogenase (short-subunit alcohol dehydrogenase family)
MKNKEDYLRAQRERAEGTSGSGSLRFVNRRVLVTGAAKGIGAAIASQFIREGARVVGVDLDANGLETLQAHVGDLPGSFIPLVADITDVEGHPDIVAHASQGEALDVLVNNAAVFLLDGPEATDYQWARTMDVNLVAPAKLTAAAVAALAQSRHAAVVNIASISGHVAGSLRWTYNAAKGGVLALTKCQALDLARDGIRVNSVSPGYTWTDVLDRSVGGNRDEWDPIYGAFGMMNRCAEPAEIATAVAFLASDDASFITGTDLLVDGGLVGMSPDGHHDFKFES